LMLAIETTTTYPYQCHRRPSFLISLVVFRLRSDAYCPAGGVGGGVAALVFGRRIGQQPTWSTPAVVHHQWHP